MRSRVEKGLRPLDPNKGASPLVTPFDFFSGRGSAPGKQGFPKGLVPLVGFWAKPQHLLHYLKSVLFVLLSPLLLVAKEEAPLFDVFYPIKSAPYLEEPASSSFFDSAYNPNLSSREGVDDVRGGVISARGAEMTSSLGSIQIGAAHHFLVGLESVSPLIASSLKQIQTWANQINTLSTHSLDSASLLQGGVARVQNTASFLCQRELVESGEVDDWSEARRAVSQMSSIDKMALLRRLSAKYPSLFVGDENVAKKVFSLSHVNGEHRELLLKVTGTLVVRGGGASIDVELPQHRKVLAELHREGKGKVFGLLKSAQKKIIKEEKLSLEERVLFEESSLPLGGLLVLLTQAQGSGADLALERYSSLIAYGRALHMLDELTSSVLSGARALRSSQLDTSMLDLYIDQVKLVSDDFCLLKTEIERQMQAEYQVSQMMSQFDQQLRERERNL